MNKQPEGFFYQPVVIRWILRIFYGICIVLVIADFVVHRHIVTEVEKLPTFYALYGFVACVLLVLMSTVIRRWVMRDEHYYEESFLVKKSGIDSEKKLEIDSEEDDRG